MIARLSKATHGRTVVTTAAFEVVVTTAEVAGRDDVMGAATEVVATFEVVTAFDVVAALLVDAGAFEVIVTGLVAPLWQ